MCTVGLRPEMTTVVKTRGSCKWQTNLLFRECTQRQGTHICLTVMKQVLDLRWKQDNNASYVNLSSILCQGKNYLLHLYRHSTLCMLHHKLYFIVSFYISRTQPVFGVCIACYITRVVQWLWLALSKGPNSVGVSLLSLEDKRDPVSYRLCFLVI
jgi:hypothetical protein